jgi:hypothetical protein
VWRYAVQVHVADHTRDEWVTVFGELAEPLFGGITADVGAGLGAVTGMV